MRLGETVCVRSPLKNKTQLLCVDKVTILCLKCKLLSIYIKLLLFELNYYLLVYYKPAERKSLFFPLKAQDIHRK